VFFYTHCRIAAELQTRLEGRLVGTEAGKWFSRQVLWTGWQANLQAGAVDWLVGRSTGM
jgi:hypothetical protein